MPSCPHCTKELGSGYTTQDALEARLSRQKDKYRAELETLKTQLGDAQESLKTSGKVGKELEAAQAQVKELRAKLDAQEQRSVLTEAELDPRFHESALTLWRAHNDGMDESDRLSLGDWLEGPARGEGSVLAAVLPSVTQEEEATSQDVRETPSVSARVPRTTQDTHRAPPRRRGPRKTPAEVRAIIQSREFNALPKEEQQRQLSALRQEVMG